MPALALSPRFDALSGCSIYKLLMGSYLKTQEVRPLNGRSLQYIYWGMIPTVLEITVCGPIQYRMLRLPSVLCCLEHVYIYLAYTVPCVTPSMCHTLYIQFNVYFNATNFVCLPLCMCWHNTVLCMCVCAFSKYNGSLSPL